MTSHESPPRPRPMVERYRRPDWVRRLNAMADSVGGDARRLVPIDAAEMLRDTEESLGPMPRGSFGDPEWQSRFEQLAGAIDRSSMHVVGRLMSRQELLRSLRTRWLLTREADAHPAIERERIAAPVIVTGPARSGTSILFELLWLDPELRAPAAWEALHPLPQRPPDDGGERLLWSECEQELWADVQPEFASIHELRSDLPVECVTLTLPCFCGTHWSMVGQLEGWSFDIPKMYDFHRRILQVLQHGAPPRTWLLKTPGHLMTLEDLFATYPDAWVVQTHRDPAKTMPSTVSTTAMVQWMRTDDVDLEPLAAAIEAAFTYALNHSVEVRSGAMGDRFVDVHFDRLMRAPVETLREAYAKMGRDLRPEHADRIVAYLRDKPKGKFGTHHYSAEDWGFDVASLRQNLAPYVEHFGITLEV